MRFLARGGFAHRHSDQAAAISARSPFKEHDTRSLSLIEGICRAAWADPGFGKELRDSYHAATVDVIGDRPNQQTIVLSCDPGYFQAYAKYFIMSYKRVGGVDNIHLHLAMPDDEALAEIEVLSCAYGAGFSASVNRSGIEARLNYPSVYLTSARFIQAQRVMERGVNCCVTLDVDGVFRSEVHDHIEALIAGHDVALIRRRMKLKASRKVLASACIFQSTALGTRFVDALSRALVAVLHEGPQYHVDQTVLHYLSAAAITDGASVKSLGLSLADHTFDDASPIWSAKGRKRKKTETFQNALRTAKANYAERTDPLR